MDQLISAHFTKRKQSKHFLEEYKSSRNTQLGPGQQGCSHANHCFISGRSWTEYCCLLYVSTQTVTVSVSKLDADFCQVLKLEHFRSQIVTVPIWYAQFQDWMQSSVPVAKLDIQF
jgi:hypothetical protein